MNWLIESPSHWILIVSITVEFGIATYRLYDDATVRQGRARKGMYGWLVEERL